MRMFLSNLERTGHILVLTVALASVPALDRSGDGAALASQTPAPDAAQHVEHIAGQTLSLLEASEHDAQAKQDALHALLEEVLDLPVIANFALGHHARSLSARERARFEDLFATYVVSGYAREMGREAIDRIEVVRSRQVTENNAAVSTRVTRPDGQTATWIWRLHQRQGGYRVVDLQTPDVSMAVSYRAEIGSSMAKDGIEGVIARLEDHLANGTAMRGDDLALSHLFRGTPIKTGGRPAQN